RWYRLMKEGKAPLIYGDGKQTMDFVYVGDIARANVAALQSDVSNDVFNIARGEETSLEELCYALIDVMGVDIKPEYIPLPEARSKVEVLRRLADVGRAREQLGFEAKIPLKQGLKSLVKWLDEQPEPVAS
ncbi:MAG: GDP-mannose 4,6-dehydratase, partial [Candidatus Omnitrophica bacterium]|nr:GDP-mannose 4,6-dehydratase [Candidatus Omnitrophota bacterium]